MKGWKMIHKMKLLRDNGVSIRGIARELAVSRNTARKYLGMDESEICVYFENRERAKWLDRYRDYMVHLLKNYPCLSAEKIRRKVKVKHGMLPVSARSVRRYVEVLKKEVALKQRRYYEPVLDMIPGVQRQVDLGELRGVPVGASEMTAHFGVFVLSYSRRMYVALSSKPVDTRTFLAMHDEAFRYFDGTPEECVYDQTKLVAIHEEFREVTYNDAFYRYATQAAFSPRVCEGYDPESKGKVEAGVKYVKNNFFYGERFSSMEDLRIRLQDWLDNVANVRIHGTTGQRPDAMYAEQEKRHMKPYRPVQLDIPGAVSGEARKVDKTALISWKSNRYSVPLPYAASCVHAREEDEKLIILGGPDGEIIAEHALCMEKGQVIKNTNHYRDYKKQVEDYEEEIRKELGEDLGIDICALLKRTSPKIYRDQLVGLTKVLARYRSKTKAALCEPLRELAQRPQLKVSFIRDYLEVFQETSFKREAFSPKQPTPHNDTQVQLARYGGLCKADAAGQEVAAHGVF